jgi:Chaperone for flagella basal body P-ring formation
MSKLKFIPLLLFVATLPGGLWGQLVRIQLREQPAVLNSTKVLVGDIAAVTSPSSQLARQIAALDVDQFTAGRSTLTVSADQVIWRIRLAGHDPASVSITGPAHATVRLADPAGTASELGQWLAAELGKGLGLDPQALNVIPQLDSHFARIAPLWEQRRNAAWQLRLPASLPVGLFAYGVEVVATDGQRQSAIIVATVTQLAAAQPLAIARQPDPATGSLINDHQVQPASAVLPEPAGPRMNVTQGTTSPDGIPAPPVKRSPPVIRPGDRVAIVFNRGPLSIRMVNARALIAGTLGDVITVENPTTRRQLPARILDPQTVELVR